MKIIQNKIAGVLLGAFVIIMACCGLEVHAAGGSTSLGASAATVNIGDAVTVTMNVSADVYAAFQMSVSYSSDVLEYTGASSNDCNGGGGALSVVSEVNGSYSISFHFKAVAPGTASVSASAVEAYAVETAEAVSISGSGASVTVNNAASDTGNTGNVSTDAGNNNGGSTDNGDSNSSTGNGSDGSSTASLSADNSLRSLTISPGTLSPSFQYSTTKYTASVGADVTSIAVDAKVSNAKATVEAVSGNTNLQPGGNAIKITVKAENGTIAVYTIMVNRGGAASTESEAAAEGAEEETEEEPQTPADNTGIQLDGISCEISEKLPEITLPEEFTKTTTTYGEKEVEAYSFPYSNLLLVYLEPIEGNDGEAQEGEGKLYFYNAAEKEFFPYICITVGQKYVLILPNSYAEVIPEGYQEADITIGEFGVKGCQQSNAAAENGQEFYLVYGVDKNGAAGWYCYDSVDMSLQRYVESEYIIIEEPQEEDDATSSALSNAYQKLEEKYKKEKTFSRITMAVLVFLLVVAIIVIINILIFKNNRRGDLKENGKNGDMDYIDFDELV